MSRGTAGDAQLFGITFSRAGVEEIAQLVTGPARHRGVWTCVTCNLDHLYNLRGNPAFKAAYDAAALRTVDGRPLAAYANRVRKLGLPLVTGADLFPVILARLRPGLHRPFFVASNAETAAALVERMQAAGFAREDIGLDVPAFGFERDAAASARLAQAIRAHGTTQLFMGVGSPKSEIWLHRHRDELGDLYAFGFGAALDFAAGTRGRAPRWMQLTGLEWLHRLSGEPRRLAPRYARNAVGFARLVLSDLAGRRVS